MIAEGKRTQTVQAAMADSEKTRLLGTAEATAIASIGKAEAERMRQKAAVYKQYGDAAIVSLVLEALPKVSKKKFIARTWTPLFYIILFVTNVKLFDQIAAEVAAPLSKTEEIVLIGGSDNTTAEISRLIGQVPPAINALTGVDISKILGKLPGATTNAQSAAIKS